jgi:hypothetical protein
VTPGALPGRGLSECGGVAAPHGARASRHQARERHGQRGPRAAHRFRLRGASPTLRPPSRRPPILSPTPPLPCISLHPSVPCSALSSPPSPPLVPEPGAKRTAAAGRRRGLRATRARRAAVHGGAGPPGAPWLRARRRPRARAHARGGGLRVRGPGRREGSGAHAGS